MNKEELLDHFAVNAMMVQIEKMGITNQFAVAHASYRMAVEMLEQRDRIHIKWAEEQKEKQRYQASDIHELDIPVRYHCCLVSENILMKQDLSNWTEHQIRKIPNLGVKGLQALKYAMAVHGLKFKGQE
jgi:DNA-directed RNA polymerase alpha subunit